MIHKKFRKNLSRIGRKVKKVGKKVESNLKSSRDRVQAQAKRVKRQVGSNIRGLQRAPAKIIGAATSTLGKLPFIGGLLKGGKFVLLAGGLLILLAVVRSVRKTK